MDRITPPLKYHGGKSKLADRIVALMPPHVQYVEPYFGGGAVLLRKDPEGVAEVVNDLHGGLVAFWRVLADPAQFAEFRRRVEAVPFSEQEFNRARRADEWRAAIDDYGARPVEEAVDFFVHCRMSLAGRMDSFTGVTRSRRRRGMQAEVSAWITAVDGLPAVHARLRRVLILCRPAHQVVASMSGPDTLIYMDPPYMKGARASPSVYDHEMTDEQHADMLDQACASTCRVMISGYSTPLYEHRLMEWNRHTFDLPNSAAGGASKRTMTECLWCNF